jgi:hypothetical protein
MQPGVIQQLKRLKASGKKLFILTNSPFFFVDGGMRYLFQVNPKTSPTLTKPLRQNQLSQGVCGTSTLFLSNSEFQSENKSEVFDSGNPSNALLAGRFCDRL